MHNIIKRALLQPPINIGVNVLLLLCIIALCKRPVDFLTSVAVVASGCNQVIY